MILIYLIVQFYILGVNIFVGGAIGEDARLQVEPAYKGIPLTEEDVVPILTDILIKQFNAKLKQTESK